MESNEYISKEEKSVKKDRLVRHIDASDEKDFWSLIETLAKSYIGVPNEEELVLDIDISFEDKEPAFINLGHKHLDTARLRTIAHLLRIMGAQQIKIENLHLNDVTFTEGSDLYIKDLFKEVLLYKSVIGYLDLEGINPTSSPTILGFRALRYFKEILEKNPGKAKLLGLSLSYNKGIGPLNQKDIETLIMIPGLRSLSLIGSDVNDAFLRKLAHCLKSAPYLEEISLGEEANITKDGIYILGSALREPECYREKLDLCITDELQTIIEQALLEGKTKALAIYALVEKNLSLKRENNPSLEPKEERQMPVLSRAESQYESSERAELPSSSLEVTDYKEATASGKNK